MGKNKALLPLPGNQAVTFVGYLVSILEECCSETLIVARDRAQAREYVFPGVRVVIDETPGIGPLMGLYSGLSAIHTTHALVVAVPTTQFVAVHGSVNNHWIRLKFMRSRPFVQCPSPSLSIEFRGDFKSLF